MLPACKPPAFVRTWALEWNSMMLQFSKAGRRSSVLASFGLCMLASLSSAAERPMLHFVAKGAEPTFAPWGTEPWIQRAALAAPDGAINDYLGRSVALDGDIAVVGAAGSDVGGAESQGAAYIFVHSGDAWTEAAKLTAPDGASGDEFGFAVSISGDTIVIGSRFAAIDGSAGRGAAYVFVHTGTDWVEQAKLTADDGIAFDELGFSVAIAGDTVLVGAPFANGSQGKVYAFARTGADWSGQGTLVAQDGASSDRFGLAVAISGDTAIMGSPSADVGANTDQGAAYVYTRASGSWSLQAKLAGDDSAPFDEFGNSAAIDGDTVIVGAHVTNIGNNGNQGAAYAFVRDGETWSQQTKFVADDGSFTDEFGFSVVVSGDTAAIGALFANPGGNENQGEAYIFRRSEGAWSQSASLVSDGGAGDEFGIGIAIDGNTALVGADFAAVGGEWRGAAYVFAPDAPPAPRADITPGTLNFELAPGTSTSDTLTIANTGDAGSTLDYSIFEAASADCGTAADASWLDVAPIDGEVAAGSSQDVTVDVDASGLVAGEYPAWLCISTSDPALGMVPIPVTLVVSGQDPDVIFVDGFDGA
jgi:hypothetical protein